MTDGKTFTAAEIDILIGLLHGERMMDVAQRLNVNPRMVALHKYEIMHSLGAKSNADLISWAIHTGILKVDLEKLREMQGICVGAE